MGQFCDVFRLAPFSALVMLVFGFVLMHGGVLHYVYRGEARRGLAVGIGGIIVTLSGAIVLCRWIIE